MKTLVELQDLVAERFENANFIYEPRELYEPIDYALSQGGKRLRPVLTLAACQMFGGDIEEAVPAAIGLEIFHNFTLLHDDIMDEAPIRRGMPSVYKKWNTNTAILSGDTMFVVAYDFVIQTKDQALKPILQLFNQTAKEVCEGQQFDMNFELRNDVRLDEYMHMIRLKTAVLIAASLKAGAIIAGASEKDAQEIYNFGIHIGLGFQLKDDLLDSFGDQSVFGKQIGNDILTDKKTYLLIRAYEKADETQKQALNAAFALKDPKEKVDAVLALFAELGIKEDTEEQMENYKLKASRNLANLQIEEASKEIMRILAKKLIHRDK